MMKNIKMFREYKGEMVRTVLEVGGASLGYNVGASLLTGIGFAIGGPVIGSLAWEIGRFAGIAGGWYVGNKLSKKVYLETSEDNINIQEVEKNLLEGGNEDVLKKIQSRGRSCIEEWIQKQSEESYENVRKGGEKTL